MTALHFEMLQFLSDLSKKVSDNPKNKVELCSTKTNSESINSYLIDIGNEIGLEKIRDKVKKSFISLEYENALLYSLEQIYSNKKFDARKVFDKYNV